MKFSPFSFKTCLFGLTDRFPGKLAEPRSAHARKRLATLSPQVSSLAHRFHNQNGSIANRWELSIRPGLPRPSKSRKRCRRCAAASTRAELGFLKCLAP
jgi:hypothetical protein